MPKAPSRSVARRRNLVNNLLSIGRVAAFPCSRCEKAKRECWVDSYSGRCAYCVGGGRSCNSVAMGSERSSFFAFFPSDADIRLSLVDRLFSEKEKLRKQAREAEDAAARSMAKATRLRRQLDFLEGRTADVVSKELAAIEELEKVEAESSKAASGSGESSGSVLGVSSPGFGWDEWGSLLGSVDGSAVQASNSS